MSTMSYAVRDSATMLRRNLRRNLRYPVSIAVGIGMPLVLLLLFVFVFGNTLGTGLGAGVAGVVGSGRDVYLDYVTPGIVLIAIAGAAQGTAIAVAMDLQEGIVNRFRTMAIARVSVLTGHVVGAVLQTLVACAVVLGVALVLGFDASASALDWLLIAGLLTLVSVAITWLSVALGMVSKNVETASNLPMPLILLPFLGSGFVPTETMPAGVRFFAEHQPFTPIMETLRGLLMGTPIGGSAVEAVAWSVAIGLGSYWWAKQLFNRDPTP
jgi:ABC-2 type transport system permease protein